METINRTQPQIFTIWSDKIKERLDPYFYVFKELEISELVPIREFAKVHGGYAFKSSEYRSDCGIPLVRIQNIQNSEIDLSDTVYIDEKYSDSCERFLLREKDILIAMTGATIGKVGRVREENLPAFLNQRVGKFVVNKNKINLDYLFFILQFDIFANQVKRLSLGGSQPNISPGSIEKIKIPLPSLSVQNKIVSMMQKVFKEKKEKEAEASKLLESIDGYVLDKLGIKIPKIKREMVFEVMSDKVENNRIGVEYWQPFLEDMQKSLKRIKTKKLGEVISNLSGGATPKITGDFYLDDNGIPFLRVQNITKIGIDLNDVKYIKKGIHEGELKRSQLKRNDLVLTITGRIGSVAVVPENFQGNINQHSVRFHLKNNINLLPDFVAIYLNTGFVNQLILREVTGGTRPALDYKAVKNIEIPIMPLSFQDKIVEKVKSYYSKAQKLKDEAKDNLKKTKQKVEDLIEKGQKIICQN